MSVTGLLDLLRRLSKWPWIWTETEVDSVAETLDAQRIGSVAGRKTYVLADGGTLSAYIHEDRVESLEITLDVFLDTPALSPSEYENKVDEYFAKYEETVSLAQQVLGAPVFNDGYGAEGFPEDQSAVWLALWTLPNARLMIQQRHEDRETPFRICIVLAPLPIAGQS